MDNTSHIVYGLIDPNSHELRYIGYTSSPKERYDKHHCLSNLKSKSHKNCWIKSLLLKNQMADIVVLEQCLSAEDLPQAEIRQIEYHRAIGCRLTNSTDGGEGNFGMKHSEETKRKMSLAATGRTMPEVQRRKISIALKGRKRKPHSTESIKKNADARRGAKRSEEFKKRLSQIAKERGYAPPRQKKKDSIET